MKINLGCGSVPLKDYINVDFDTLDDLRKRYPNRQFSNDLTIEQWDIFNLPVDDNSVDKIKCDCLFEHLDFREEKLIFEEVKRVLKVGGIFNISVPDFEHVVSSWLKADDDWQDWYRDDDEAIEKNHWFGTYEYSFKNRWGYITAVMFGSQNGNGQYHKNCYTKQKLRNIFKKLNFKIIQEETYLWLRGGGDDRTLRFITEKRG